jgi:hypothetical protein
MKERENRRREGEGEEIFIRVSKNKFNGYRSSLLPAYANRILFQFRCGRPHTGISANFSVADRILVPVSVEPRARGTLGTLFYDITSHKKIFKRNSRSMVSANVL